MDDCYVSITWAFRDVTRRYRQAIGVAQKLAELGQPTLTAKTCGRRTVDQHVRARNRPLWLHSGPQETENPLGCPPFHCTNHCTRCLATGLFAARHLRSEVSSGCGWGDGDDEFGAEGGGDALQHRDGRHVARHCRAQRTTRLAVLRTAVLTLERAGPTRHERGASRRRCVQRGSPCCISMRAVRRHVRSLGSPDEVAVAVGFAQKNRSHPVVADDLPAAPYWSSSRAKRGSAEAASSATCLPCRSAVCPALAVGVLSDSYRHADHAVCGRSGNIAPDLDHAESHWPLAGVDQRECEFPSWPFGCVHDDPVEPWHVPIVPDRGSSAHQHGRARSGR
jgi:hypothetical protein